MAVIQDDTAAPIQSRVVFLSMLFFPIIQEDIEHVSRMQFRYTQ
uniref:Uncharacterized protein n=1 Tax=viral metagenome TaxID=1070528 RepID=A0A6C0DB65_9ZZZZ